MIAPINVALYSYELPRSHLKNTGRFAPAAFNSELTCQRYPGEIGCPRVVPGRQTVSNGASRKDVLDWIASALRECADHGKKFGVKIGVQNHGDFLATAAQHLELVRTVASEWCGPIVDTGYFKTPDFLRISTGPVFQTRRVLSCNFVS
jgi:hypothetical protein